MSDQAKWYVVHTYSGYEKKVATSLENVVENRKLQDLICEVKVPTEIVTEINNDKKKEVERKKFPGYVFVKMIQNDETWYICRNIRGVTGFVGPGFQPVPLSDDEVQRLGVETKEVVINFNIGDSVSIKDGYFAGFIGRVDEINKEAETLKLTVSMMGKDVPIELSIGQVTSLT